ncbi:MAG: AAA family ATPase [Chloroflexota bacterium]|nr:AAA family ATPase [Chloroflexota bacterium]
MRITSLRLSDVKRHRALELQLAPGLTVIRGPNEAGKSTIQRALEMVLFRRATSAAQELEGVRPWSDAEAVPTIEIDFEDEGIVGRLSKSFAGARGTTRLEWDGEVETDPAAVDQRMAELTGLPSEKFFRSTASIRHQELADLDRDEGALRDRLHQSMSGADRGTWAARRKLQDALARYRSEGHKNPGLRKQARSEVERLAKESLQGEARLASLVRDRSALADARAKRETMDERLSEAQVDLDAAGRAVAARDRLVKAEADYTRYKRATELREDVARLEASHPSPMALPVLRSGVEHLRSLEYGISEQRAELSSQPDPSHWQADVEKAPSWRPVALLPVLLLAAAVGAFLVIGDVAGMVLAGVLLAAALGVAFVAWRLRSRASQVRLQNEMVETEISRRLRGRSDLEEALRSAERERDQRLASLGMADLPAAEKSLSAETEHVAAIDRLRAEYRGLLGDAAGDEVDVAQLRDRKAAAADEARHALAGMGPIGTDPDGYRHRAETHLRAARGERERAGNMEAAAQARLDANTVDAEEVAAVAEQLDEARDRLATCERRLRIYEMALGALDSAEQATMKKAARFLEGRMSSDIAAITDGRYSRVEVDESELSFRVFSAEAGDWVAADDLSQGTIDQIYLAARLGLVRQVTQERRPPLVFDDPFVTFDDDRARRAVGLLRSLASDHQVIYLTCSDRYDSVAGAVIALPAPAAAEEPPGSDGVADAARSVAEMPVSTGRRP